MKITITFFSLNRILYWF